MEEFLTEQGGIIVSGLIALVMVIISFLVILMLANLDAQIIDSIIGG